MIQRKYYSIRFNLLFMLIHLSEHPKTPQMMNIIHQIINNTPQIINSIPQITNIFCKIINGNDTKNTVRFSTSITIPNGLIK